MNGGGDSVKAPKTVKELSAVAENGHFQKVTKDSLSAGITVFLRTARNLRIQAEMLLADDQNIEQNLDMAFILHMRYAQFILNYLPQHREYGNVSPIERRELMNHVNTSVMETIQHLHGRIKARTEEYEKNVTSRDLRLRELARQRELTRKAEAESERESRKEPQSVNETLQVIDAIRSLQLDRKSVPPKPPPVYNRTYTYPGLPTSLETPEARISPTPLSPLPSHTPPPLPHKPSKDGSYFPPPSPLIHIKLPAPSAGYSPVGAFNYSIRARTEGGADLRTLYIPLSLREKFLKIAAPNTARNLETCGVLCGVLRQNALFLTTLVIPAQESTSDTCSTTDEEALFGFQDKHNLLTLGWIHTHPTQTCFLSSLDLHTHCSYQLMLAEAIAIVCAPRQSPSYGIFRLTDPPGVQTITKCKRTGLFHPHAEHNVYTGAGRDEQGHVLEYDREFDIADLR